VIQLWLGIIGRRFHNGLWTLGSPLNIGTDRLSVVTLVSRYCAKILNSSEFVFFAAEEGSDSIQRSTWFARSITIVSEICL